MPTYGYACVCGLLRDMMRSVEQRNDPVECVGCQQEMQRQLTAPPFKFAGRVVQGGGPDRYTADVLGVRVDELPDGLKTTK